MNVRQLGTACATGALLIASLGICLARAEGESPHSFSANVAMTTNYLFRGVSQTGNGPAIQGGFDYVYTPLDLYAGVWGSNVDSSSGTGYWVVPGSNPQVVPTEDYLPARSWSLSAPGYDGASLELDLKLGWAKTFDKLGVDIGLPALPVLRRPTQPGQQHQRVHLALSYDLTYLTPKSIVNYSDDLVWRRGRLVLRSQRGGPACLTTSA